MADVQYEQNHIDYINEGKQIRKATCITQVCQETNPRAVTNSVVNIRERNKREETYDMNFKGQGPGDRRSVPQCFGILEETSPSTTSYPPGQCLQEQHVRTRTLYNLGQQNSQQTKSFSRLLLSYNCMLERKNTRMICSLLFPNWKNLHHNIFHFLTPLGF